MHLSPTSKLGYLSFKKVPIPMRTTTIQTSNTPSGEKKIRCVREQKCTFNYFQIMKLPIYHYIGCYYHLYGLLWDSCRVVRVALS